MKNTECVIYITTKRGRTWSYLKESDPPLNNGDLIYIRGSECPCRGELRGRPLTQRGAPA